MKLLQATAIFLSFAGRADAFAVGPAGVTPAVPDAALEAKVLVEWLLVGDRYSSTAADLTLAALDTEQPAQQEQSLSVITTRSVAAGEVLFRLNHPAIWSAAAAYRDDRDLGPRLRDYAPKAGPGFETVALAGALAAEQVRRFRSREGLGVAPESAGFMVPSKWGALARWLWKNDSKKDEEQADLDESFTDAVSQGVNLLVPLLDMAARRYWSSGDTADAPEESVPSEEWTRKALVGDGAPRSWSRADLETVARQSMGLVIKNTRSPPPFLLEGTGTLVPGPFVDERSAPPETWPSGESLAFVPLVDYVLNNNEGNDEPNAVLGTPPPRRHGEDDCLWCVATRQLDAGERVVASDPWP